MDEAASADREAPDGSDAPGASALIARTRRLLDAVRAGDPVDSHLSALAGTDGTELAPLREDRRAALAFWVNLYNAGTQVLLDRRPGLYESPLRTLRFFSTDCVAVAGEPLSLDDIEHGILRGSRSKYGLGYLPRVFSGRFERRYSLESVDPRVHFALNCGAASCPPIRYYDLREIDDQLDLATGSYLDATVEYDSDAGTARVPRLFLWYRGDFDGASGIRAFLREHGAIPDDADPRLRYRSWDWSRAPAEFD